MNDDTKSRTNPSQPSGSDRHSATGADSGQPLVSVYIPSKDRLEQLKAAVDSVFAQTYPNIELIVVDDGSSDGTWDYLEGLSAERHNVIAVRFESSAGACMARNEAIRRSAGAFLTGLDDDDEFLPGHVEALVENWFSLERASVRPAALYVQCIFRKVKGQVAFLSAKPKTVDADGLLDKNVIGGQIFTLRDRFLKAGLFDEQMLAWQDLEFYYRILRMFGKAHLLETPSYVVGISLQSRISNSDYRILRDACEMMYDKHGGGNARIKQRLLLQLHAGHYSHPVGLSHIREFIRLGLWPVGYAKLLRRLIRSWRRHLL